MDWVKLLIPLIAIAVWILSHLASSQKEPPRRPSPRPVPPDQDAGKPRSSSAELEGFLEEMRQRKQYEKDQPVEPVLVEPAPRPKPPPMPRREERREPRRDEPRRDERPEDRRRSRAVGAKPPQRRAEPAVVITPMETPPSARSSSPTITAGATPLMVTPPTVGMPVTTGPLTLQNIEAPKMHGPVAPAARIVADLLKNRQSLAAAFLLREILDRPLSQRRRSQ